MNLEIDCARAGSVRDVELTSQRDLFEEEAMHKPTAQVAAGWHYLEADPDRGMVRGMTVVSVRGVLCLRWPQAWLRRSTVPLQSLLPAATNPVTCSLNDQLLGYSLLADLLLGTASQVSSCWDSDANVHALADVLHSSLGLSSAMVKALAMLVLVCEPPQRKALEWSRLPNAVASLSKLESPLLMPLLMERQECLPSRSLRRLLAQQNALAKALIRTALLHAPQSRQIFFFWAATFTRQLMRACGESERRLSAFLLRGGAPLLVRLAEGQAALDGCAGPTKCAASELFLNPSTSLRFAVNERCSDACLRRSLAAWVRAVALEIRSAVADHELLIERVAWRLAEQADAALHVILSAEIPPATVEAMPLWVLAEGGEGFEDVDPMASWPALPPPPPNVDACLANAGLVVRELTSFQALQTEGAEMGHCISEPAPFASQCQAGLSRIFSITSAAHGASMRATMELSGVWGGFELVELQDQDRHDLLSQRNRNRLAVHQWRALDVFIAWTNAVANSLEKQQKPGNPLEISPLGK